MKYIILQNKINEIYKDEYKLVYEKYIIEKYTIKE